MNRTQKALLKALFVMTLHGNDCNAQEKAEPEPPKQVISYQDIGKNCEIHGKFGKLYTEFTLKGVVKKPFPKSDANGTIRIDITHLRGKALAEKKVNVAVHTKSILAEGSEVELVVREEANLWFPEGIDDVGSAPDTSHLGKLACVVSLHERRVLSHSPPPR